MLILFRPLLITLLGLKVASKECVKATSIHPMMKKILLLIVVLSNQISLEDLIHMLILFRPLLNTLLGLKVARIHLHPMSQTPASRMAMLLVLLVVLASQKL
jgi:hypothetical protein